MSLRRLLIATAVGAAIAIGGTATAASAQTTSSPARIAPTGTHSATSHLAGRVTPAAAIVRPADFATWGPYPSEGMCESVQAAVSLYDHIYTYCWYWHGNAGLAAGWVFETGP